MIQAAAMLRLGCVNEGFGERMCIGIAEKGMDRPRFGGGMIRLGFVQMEMSGAGHGWGDDPVTGEG